MIDTMKHISHGRSRICGTPVPEQGGYMSDEKWRLLPECPECFGKSNITLAPHEPKVHSPVESPAITKTGLYLRQYLE